MSGVNVLDKHQAAEANTLRCRLLTDVCTFTTFKHLKIKFFSHSI